MDAQDFRNLQEAYIGVYDYDIREKLEFESWVNNLLEEGYDLSDYTWEEMYENYIQLDEAIYSEKGKAKAAEMIAKRSTPSGRAKSGKGANVAQIRQIRGSGRGRFDREGLGGTPMTPTMAKNPIKKQNYDGTGNKAARRAAALNKESYDLYDIILSHLLDEGYADTQEAALAIMGNMSEEWSQSIISEGPNYDKNRQRAAKRAAERNEARKRGQTGIVPGIGYVSPRPERETYRDAAGVERHTSGARMPQK